jgi:hypothetical protein
MVKDYQAQTESHGDKSIGPWVLVLALMMLAINLVGKLAKSFEIEEYKMIKMTETIM